MWVQKYLPNVLVAAIRGWCLKYVDDGGNSPQRSRNARTALNIEIDAGRLRGDIPPVGLWVVGFLDLLTGSYAADDHVFFMRYLGNGRYEIRDSETNSGQRGVYNTIEELLAWFGNYSPRYVGWSTQCDGRIYIEVKGEDIVKPTEAQVRELFRVFSKDGRQPTAEQVRSYTSNDIRNLYQDLMTYEVKPTEAEVREVFKAYIRTPINTPPNTDQVGYYTQRPRSVLYTDVALDLKGQLEEAKAAGNANEAVKKLNQIKELVKEK